MYMAQNPTKDPVNPNYRLGELQAILAMTKKARDDARGLGLDFEVHLLEMAAIALSEALEKETQNVDLL